MDARRFLLLLFGLFTLALLIFGLAGSAQGRPSVSLDATYAPDSGPGQLAPKGGSPTFTPTATSTATCGPGGWMPGPPIPVAGIIRAVGVYFPANGKFYTMGGRTSDAAGSDLIHPYEYTPGNPGSWITKTASFPDNQVSNMACGVLTESGTPYIYCVGGLAATQTTATARVFRYNPITDQIMTLASGDDWPGDASGTIMPGGFAVVSNKLYIMGGFDILVRMTGETWAFDPTQPVGSKWARKQDYPVARGYIPATAIGGLIYTGGGTDFQDGTLIDSNDSYRYDPVANNWTAIANIPRATGETRAVAEGGKMWVLGGGRTAPNPSYEADVYDPGSNTWSLGPPFGPPARRTFPADSDGNHIWLVGGYTPNTATNTMVIYNPPVPCPTVTGTPPTATSTPSLPPTTPTLTPTPWQFCSESITVGPTWCDNNETGSYSYRLRAIAICTDFTYATLTFTPTLYVAPGVNGPWTAYYQGSSQTIGGGEAWDITITDTLTVGPVPPPNTVYHVRIDERWCITHLGCSLNSTNTPIAPLCSQVTPTPIGSRSPTRSPSSVGTATSTFTATSTRVATPFASTTATVTTTACPIQFTDVPQGSTFYPYIRCMACKGIISGYYSGCETGDPCFRPYNNVTRGQLAKIVSNSAGFSEIHTIQTFVDVPTTYTFYQYIERLASRGIIAGYNDLEHCPMGTPCFLPANTATRGQLAKIDCLAYGCAGTPTEQTFEDVPPTYTFYTQIEQLYALGAINGYPCGTPPAPACVPPLNRPFFLTGNSITRGQTAKIVTNTFFPHCDTQMK